MFDEAGCVAAARAGDLTAFNRLVLHHQQTAYNVALRTLGDPDAAEDVTQEAFFAAYRGLAQFRGGSFRAWLLRIVVNACYDRSRRQRRRPAQSLDQLLEADDTPFDPIDPTPNPEERVLTQELAARLQRALNELPADQRVTVVLCDVQGLSYDEAAEATGVPLGTVKSRLSRARARLRELLQPYRSTA